MNCFSVPVIIPAAYPTHFRPLFIGVANHGSTVAAEVARMAYQIYVQEGYPAGRAKAHWLAAESSLRQTTAPGRQQNSPIEIRLAAADESQTPVFPKEVHHPRPAIAVAKPAGKTARQDKKSRDNHEDRGERKIKTSRESQTFPHSH